MLHLLDNNKAGQYITVQDIRFNLKEVFKTTEDSFTSSVFSLLFYLPTHLFWQILYRSCYNPNLPPECGSLVAFDFWPRWNGRGTTNSSHVEPDLFLEFEDVHLLVEAKRYDYESSQNRIQWSNEIRSYYNQYDADERKPLFFLAVAGLAAGQEQPKPVEITELGLVQHINFTRWTRILSEVKRVHHKESLGNETSQSGLQFILEDLFLAFRIHGFLTGELLGSMPSGYRLQHTFIPALDAKKKGRYLFLESLLSVSSRIQSSNLKSI